MVAIAGWRNVGRLPGNVLLVKRLDPEFRVYRTGVRAVRLHVSLLGGGCGVGRQLRNPRARKRSRACEGRPASISSRRRSIGEPFYRWFRNERRGYSRAISRPTGAGAGTAFGSDFCGRRPYALLRSQGQESNFASSHPINRALFILVCNPLRLFDTINLADRNPPLEVPQIQPTESKNQLNELYRISWQSPHVGHRR